MRLFSVVLVDPLHRPRQRKVMESRFVVLAETPEAAVDALRAERPSEFIHNPKVEVEPARNRAVLVSRWNRTP